MWRVRSPSWEFVGDPVMGGKSEGAFSLTAQGKGQFEGMVRPDNGGGFASFKYDLPVPIDGQGWTGIAFEALGDGRTYKIGLRHSTNRNRVVYQQPFLPDSGRWTKVRLPFSDFIPTWRGRTVTDAEALDPHQLESLSMFVSGGQFGPFRLLLDDWFLY